MLIHFNYLYSIQQFQKATLSNIYNKILKQIFVELTGIEPATLALQTRCSPS